MDLLSDPLPTAAPVISPQQQALLPPPAADLRLPVAAAADAGVLPPLAVVPVQPVTATAAIRSPTSAAAATMAMAFTVRGLVAMASVTEKAKGGTGGSSWGGLRKALNNVVGEKLDTMQVTIGECNSVCVQKQTRGKLTRC
jgi:hypothetical protein